MSIAETEISRMLNTHMFQTVWNNIRSEFRNNIRPILINERSVRGNIIHDGGDITLPSLDTSYYLYAFPFDATSFTINADRMHQWRTSDWLQDEFKTEFTFHDAHGRIYPRSKVFLTTNEFEDTLYIAVPHYIMKSITPERNFRQVYLQVWKDTDAKGVITRQAFDGTDLTDRNLAWARYSSVPAYKAHVFGDGFMLHNISGPDAFAPFKYVEVVIDHNINFGFEIDLTSDEENRNFVGDDGKYRQIVHIPKELNPENRIITHNTCDVYAVVRSTGKGIWIHRAHYNGAFKQITHNDFSFPREMVTAARNSLGTDDIKLVVYIRRFGKDLRLQPDASFIYLLYSLTDKKILDALEGRSPENLLFWTAAKLEQSPYVKAMWDCPGHSNTDTVASYVDVFGWSKTVSLIAKRIVPITIGTTHARPFLVAKPAMYVGLPCHVRVYYQNKKIPDAKVVVQNTAQHVSIELDTSIAYVDNMQLLVEFVVRDSQTSVAFTPSASGRTVVVPFQKFKIFRKTSAGEASVRTLLTTKSHYYTDATDASIVAKKFETDGSTTLSFLPVSDDTEFVIQKDNANLKAVVNVDAYIDNNRPIQLDLEFADNAPLLGERDVVSFLNGRFLTPGVDVVVSDHLKQDNYLPRAVAVTNRQYIKPEGGNVLEVYTQIADPVATEYGFMREELCGDSDSVIAYFQNTSLLFVDGYVVPAPEVTPAGLVIPDGFREGALFKVSTALPEQCIDMVGTEGKDVEKTRLAAAYEYVVGKQPDPPALHVIDGSHDLVSLLVMQVYLDYIEGKLSLGEESIPERFTKQIGDYLHIKNFDPVFATDMRYVDVQYGYSAYTYANPVNMRVHTMLMETAGPTDKQVDAPDLGGN